MCLFRKKTLKHEVVTDSKFKIGDFVDFKYRDDIYFGNVSDIYKVENIIFYDIDIAGQCPTTVTKVSEDRLIRIHK